MQNQIASNRLTHPIFTLRSSPKIPFFSIITHLQSSCIIHAIHEIRLIVRNTRKNRRNGVNKQNTDIENITLEKVSKNKL